MPIRNNANWHFKYIRATDNEQRVVKIVFT